jgi:RNA polymerase primary sigma factor
MEATSNVPLLTKAEELELAREIEALELARWSTLLSYRPALELVSRAVAAELPDDQANPVDALLSIRPGSARLHWDRTVARVAQELRALDIPRNALRAAERSVRTGLKANRRAQPYLQRVARARELHEAAKTKFLAANLRLVVSMANRYIGAPLSREDIIQEGNIGLMAAVERFDHRRELRFSTYATWWIRHHITRAISDKGRLIRIPNHALDAAALMARATQAKLAKSGELPSDEELTTAASINAEMLPIIQSIARLEQPHSLDRAYRPDGPTLHDTLADPEEGDAERDVQRDQQWQRIHEAMGVLSPFEVAILEFRFGLNGGDELTLREVGERYNLSRERIRQIEAGALAKLRNAMHQSAQPKAA